jgi:hypothetical protein
LKVFDEGAFASCLVVVVQVPTRLQQVFSVIIYSTKQLLRMLGRVQGVRRCATARTFLLRGGHRLRAYQESLRDSHCFALQALLVQPVVQLDQVANGWNTSKPRSMRLRFCVLAESEEKNLAELEQHLQWPEYYMLLPCCLLHILCPIAA